MPTHRACRNNIDVLINEDLNVHDAGCMRCFRNRWIHRLWEISRLTVEYTSRNWGLRNRWLRWWRRRLARRGILIQSPDTRRGPRRRAGAGRQPWPFGLGVRILGRRTLRETARVSVV